MKKFIGILLLILGLVAGVRTVVSLSSSSSPAGSGSAAYDSGRKVGMFLGPIVFIGLGAWLISRD